ncbi:unnamed protein product [Thelazia callipaeda]|uniref:Uncharacterized protein n=1 Tax=Thelazia callipaeda TaxID=103827 RepID=A0A3P7L245_THECL|nr:unnamed protein product [Thelazia callipaeda]
MLPQQSHQTTNHNQQHQQQPTNSSTLNAQQQFHTPLNFLTGLQDSIWAASEDSDNKRHYLQSSSNHQPSQRSLLLPQSRNLSFDGTVGSGQLLHQVRIQSGVSSARVSNPTSAVFTNSLMQQSLQQHQPQVTAIQNGLTQNTNKS